MKSLKEVNQQRLRRSTQILWSLRAIALTLIIAPFFIHSLDNKLLFNTFLISIGGLIGGISLFKNNFIFNLEKLEKSYLDNLKKSETIDTLKQRLDFAEKFDSLTGFINLYSFREEVKALMKISGEQEHGFFFAVVLFDIDRFKRLNEAFGYGTGDEVIKIVGERIKEKIGAETIIARPCGDEFVILIHGASEEDIENKIKNISMLAYDKISATGYNLDFNITASVGVAIWENEDSVDELMRKAEKAMYYCKEKGGDQYKFYGKDLETRDIERLTFENELIEAVKNKQLTVHYQPKWNVRKNDFSGMEALVRWIHPTRGMISPFEFIPIAEENGLIVDIGNFVLNESCKLIKKIKEEYNEEYHISVNLSARQFSDSDIVGIVKAAIEEHQIDAHLLDLEVTESMVMTDINSSIKTLKQLKQYGISISIDDFGTGHSSLAYLKKLPVDTLKIDRTFVKNLENNSDDLMIVLSILGLAHNLQLSVVAEGAETKPQVDILTENGCDFIQGYYFSKPLPVDELMIKLFEK